MSMMADPAIYRLKIYHGMNLKLGFKYWADKEKTQLFDFTNCEVQLLIWNPVTKDILLSVSSEDVGTEIVLGGVEGTINVDIDEVTVNALPLTGSAGCNEYAWSFRVIDSGGDPDVLIHGPCQVLETWASSE